jgi:hypothetical protein
VKTPPELAEINGGNISLFTSEYPQHLVLYFKWFLDESNGNNTKAMA